MTAVLAGPGGPAVPAGAREGGRGAAVCAVAVRQVMRGALVVLAVAAGMSAVVAVQYRSLVTGPLDLAAVASLAANPAIRTLFGEPVGLDTAGGFTVWRTGTPVAVLVGVWAVTAATRITRGEEAAGRWHLVLAGPVRLPTVVAYHLGVLVAAQLLVGVVVAATLGVTGTGLTGSVTYGAGLSLVGVLFAGVGVLTAQLVTERRTATALAAGLLGGGLLLRMVADGVEVLGWAMWLTPFGLLAEVAPYVGNRLAPLGVLATAGALTSVVAVIASGRRDVGGGLLPVRAIRPARLALLGSVAGFALRRTAPAAGGWALGLVAYYFLIGVLTVSMTDFLAANPAFAAAAAAAGFPELGSVRGYAASLFGLLPIPVGVFAATRLAAAAGDEVDGRLSLLLAAPLSRTRWALTETLVVAATCVVLAAAAGAALWTGAVLVDAPLGLRDALGGAGNALPVALLGLGAALVALGLLPRAVLALGAVPVAGGFLLQVLAETLAWPRSVQALSPYAHLAAVPVEPVDVRGALGLLAAAVALGAAGIVALGRRDLGA